MLEAWLWRGHSVWKTDEPHFKFGPKWALGAKGKEYLGSRLRVGSDRDSCFVRWGQGRRERLGDDGLWLTGIAAPGGASGGGAE